MLWEELSIESVTDELIGLLGASFASEPAKSPAMLRRIALGAAIGAAGALCLALLALGVRPDLGEGKSLTFLLAKLAFALAVGVLALRYLGRIARPGGERRVHLGMAALPFAAVAACVSAGFCLALGAAAQEPVSMFSEAQAYERFMCRWSRQLGPLLVEFAGVQ